MPSGSASEALARPLQIGFRPRGHPELAVEVLDRAEVRRRVDLRELTSRQRTDFHLLIVCTGGRGHHHVDFEAVDMERGVLLHVHPGQVQEFRFEPHFDATMVVYRAELDRTFPPEQTWYPGSDVPTRWHLDTDTFRRVADDVERLADAQRGFDGSSASQLLMESLLTALLARLSLSGGTSAAPAHLPEPYVRFRHHLEENLLSRPTVAAAASTLGYSTRTLDRACQAAVGRTAKELTNERVALEIRRLLTHSDLGLTRIGASLGFTDASSFSKFVQRHLGATPTAIRDDSLTTRPA